MKPEQKQESDFGDFQEIKEDKETNKSEEEAPLISRVRRTRGNELIGIILQRLGGNRMEVKTTDGKIRNCRVPGRYRRRLWLRPKNIVIIVPWEYDDGKGDVIYKYPPAAVNQLRRQGILNTLTEEF